MGWGAREWRGPSQPNSGSTIRKPGQLINMGWGCPQCLSDPGGRHRRRSVLGRRRPPRRVAVGRSPPSQDASVVSTQTASQRPFTEGQKIAGCTVFTGTGHFGANGIAYSGNDNGETYSMNGDLTVGVGRGRPLPSSDDERRWPQGLTGTHPLTGQGLDQGGQDGRSGKERHQCERCASLFGEYHHSRVPFSIIPDTMMQTSCRRCSRPDRPVRIAAKTAKDTAMPWP